MRITYRVPAAAVGAVLLCSCLLSQAEDQFKRQRDATETERNAAVAAMEERRAPSIDGAEWVNSKPLSWEDLRGSVVLLDFWGAWCNPCQETVPYVKALYEHYRNFGLVVVGIHTEREAEKGKAFVQEHQLTYPIAIDKDSKLAKNYRVSQYPNFYLIDHKGVLRYADLHPTDLENAVRKLLQERRAELGRRRG